MKRIVTLLVIGVFLATTSLSAAGVASDSKGTLTAQSPAQSAIAVDPVNAADSRLRSTIASEMVKEATKRGLAIQADKIVYATRDDVIAANTGLQGLENITEDQLANGADVGFVYLSLPAEAGIAKGYYTVRMFLTPGASSGTAQLVDGNGNVAAELAVQN